VDDKLEMFFGKAAFDFGELEGGPGAAAVHGFAAIVEGLLEWDAGASPAATGCGEEPFGIAMPLPEGAKLEEEFGRDGDVSFASSFCVFCGDTQGEHFAINVGGFEVEGFGKTKPALIDGGEECPVSAVTKCREKQDDFLAGEDVGQWFFTAYFDLRPDLPAEVEVIAVEGAQGADGLVDSAPCEISLGLKVEEEVENLTAF
jgi:hypothetical protein